MKIAYMNYNPINKHLYTDITFLNIVYIFITYYTYISFYLHFQIVQVAWVLSTVIMGINIYFFSTSFIRWLVHSELPRILSTIISTLIFPFMAAYIGALIYLVFKKVNVFVPLPSTSVSNETEVEVRRQDDKVDDIAVC